MLLGHSLFPLLRQLACSFTTSSHWLLVYFPYYGWLLSTLNRKALKTVSNSIASAARIPLQKTSTLLQCNSITYMKQDSNLKTLTLFFSAEKYIYFHLTSVNSNSRLSNISITCQSVSAAREGYQRHYAVIQIYRQDHRGVFAPSFVELDVSELAGIAASLGSLEDEVAENKSVNK